MPLNLHPEAYATLEDYCGKEEFTPDRQRMARVPEGGLLIENKLSAAPGFQVETVCVMAGVSNTSHYPSFSTL